MTEREERLQAFFVRYGEALAAGDLRTISNCFAVPGLVLSDVGSISIADHEEIETAFRGTAEAYRAQGLVAARPTIVSYEAITERLVSVDVLWNYFDEQGRSAQEDAYRYLLRIDHEAEPQIQVVIATPGR
jgi:hypothetical protein